MKPANDRQTTLGFDQQLAELLSDPSFIRWIKEEANPQEELKWERWEAQSTLHAALKSEARLFYDLPLEVTQGEDVEEQLSRLKQRIDHSKNVFDPPAGSRPVTAWKRWAVAASMALLLGVVGVLALYNQQEPASTSSKPLYSTIETGYGERGTLKISDGSLIRLNANSILRYSPKQFSRSEVEVWLEGEAYFSIVRNPDSKKRTFIVHTPDGSIQVLGTRFNVNTRFHRTGVVLEEGAVEIVRKDSLNSKKNRLRLKPGQRAQFSHNRPDINIQVVDTSIYTAWLEDKLVFEDTPLNEIIRHIQQIYGVTLKAENQSILKKKITGTLRNPDLETLLEGIEQVFNLNIQQQTEDLFLITSKTNKQFQKE